MTFPIDAAIFSSTITFHLKYKNEEDRKMEEKQLKNTIDILELRRKLFKRF
jgi:hypothetical protein